MKTVFTLITCIFFIGINGFGQVTESFDKPNLSSGSLACWSAFSTGFSACARQLSPEAAALAAVPSFSLNTTTSISGSGSLHITDTAGQDLIGTTTCVAGMVDYLYSTASGADGDTVSFDLRIDSIALPGSSFFSVDVICGDFVQEFNYTVADTGSIIHISTSISGSNGGGAVTILFFLSNQPYGGPITDYAFFSADIDNFSTNAVPDPANSCLLLLPVQLSGFTAVADKNNVQLKWQTTAEINFDHFIIEHSINGNEYTQAGQVQAINQTSNQSVNYTWLHTAPSAGINYYRLKMVDKDGQYKFSDTRVVRMSILPGKTMMVYPNPARSSVQIMLPEMTAENTTVQLYSAEGRLIQTIAAGRQQLISLKMDALVNGVYFIKLVKDKSILYTKAVIKL